MHIAKFIYLCTSFFKNGHPDIKIQYENGERKKNETCSTIIFKNFKFLSKILSINRIDKRYRLHLSL